MASKGRPSSGPAAASAALAAAGAALPTYLPRQRWFGAKARAVSAATPADHVAIPGTPAILALFRLEIQGSAPETYLVPLLTDRRRRDAAPVGPGLPFADQRQG